MVQYRSLDSIRSVLFNRSAQGFVTLVALLVSAAAAMPAHAALTWTKGSYTVASWQAAENNVLNKATCGTSNLARLSDGKCEKFSTSGGDGNISNNQVVEWTLASPVYVNGLNVYSWWNDNGRDGINIQKVEVKTQGSDTWVNTGASAVSQDANTSANYVKLSDSTGGLLSDSAVSALRITFGPQDNSKTCYTEVELISVTPSPIPDDPPAGETDYVVVTNGATMHVMQDWTSGTNLVWDFGSGAVPTVFVAAGMTVTIRGEILGSVGFRKLGSGTLVLAHPKTRPVTVSGTFSAADLAAYQRDCRYGITVLPLPHENVLGSCPEVVVSNVVTGAILESGVDYSVAYFATNAPGFGYAVVTGLNDFSSYVSTNTFDLVLDKVPSGYRQYDWLYVDNTASMNSWIDTQVVPSGDWKIQLDFATYAMNDWLNTYLFCARTTDGTSKQMLVYFNSYQGHPYIGLGDDAFVSDSSINTASWVGEHSFVYENGEAKLDGAVCATASTTGFTCGGRLILFGGYYNTTTVATGGGFTGAFREAKFHDGSGNLRLHLVPCVRESDGAIGVYNLGAENHGFMANGGTGSFAVDGVGRALIKNGGFENSTTISANSGNWGSISSSSTARTALWSGSATLSKVNSAWNVPSSFITGTYCACLNNGARAQQTFYEARPVKARLTFNYMHRVSYNPGVPVYMTTYLDGQLLHNEVSVPVNSSTKLTLTVNDIIIPYSPTGHVLRIQGRTDNGADGTFYLDNVSLVVTEMLGVSGDLELSVPMSAELMPGETLQCAVTNATTGAALVAGDDYTITTEEVIVPSSSLIAGYWRVIATGINDYAGQAATNYSHVVLKEGAEGYDYAMAITPNASYVTSTLVDFPLLVRLSSTRQSGFDPADCGTNGENLRFILTDGTMLAHEIDYWDVDGESTVWVRVPALTADTVIFALWSPKSGTVHHLPRNPKAVWCDYVGVWHMSEAAATLYDSSGNGYTATNLSPDTVTAAANPVVGRAAYSTDVFMTTVTDLLAANAAKPISNRSKVTFSGWLSVDSAARSDFASGYIIYRKYVGWKDGSGGACVQYLPDYVNESSFKSAIVQVFLNSGTGYSDFVNTYPAGSKVASKRQTWVYLTVSLDGATKAYYFDGAQTGTETAAHGLLGPDSTGALSFGTNNKTSGRGDEIRIRNGVASAAWVLADYRNMATQDFVSYAAIGKKTFSVPAIAGVTLVDVATDATPAVAPVDALSGDALAEGVDYTLKLMDNTFGNVTAKAIVTGIGNYEGCVATNTFEILGIASTNLAANADWSAYANPRIASSATVDLKGHALRVSALYAGGTVTDSVGGGQLIFDVPAGKTVTLNTALTGALKLVKTGAGVLVASKAGQTYTGGTDVLGGVLRCGGNGNINDTAWFGPNTSTVRCYIYVGPNGVLDPAGSSGWGYHAVALDGGMVSNTVARTGTSSVCFNPVLSTTGDVTLATMEDYSWTSAGGDLKGSTLKIWNNSAGKRCYAGNNWAWSNGTIHYASGGWFDTTRGAVDIHTVDFRQTGGALNVANALSVRDYYCSYSGDSASGTAALNVYGMFTPASTYFYGPTMQNGSAIDLSAKSGAWSTTSPNAGHHNGNKTVKFASNARVGIGLGARSFSDVVKVLSYTSEPTTVTFTNNEWFLSRRADGIYVVGTQAPGAPVLPVVVPVQYIRSGAPATPALSLVNAATGADLVAGTDYDVVYSDNAAPGTATVVVTGKGAYAGLSFTDQFTIANSFAASTATPPDAFMDGTLDWSGVTVTDVVTGDALVEGSDYTYTNTLSGHTATATITGVGYYAGTTVVYAFDITPRAYFTDFRYKMEITPADGMVTTSLANFPALVRLSAANQPGFSPADIGEDGSELAFLLEDGGEMLPCEVDYIDPNGECTLWVKVPSLAADTKIYAVWSRKDERAALAPDPVATWPNYVGVWHFSEASGIARDSSGNGYHSTNNGGGTVSNVNAKVGLARNMVNRQQFNTGVYYLTGSGKVKPISNRVYFTVSGWEYSTVDIATTGDKYPQLFRKGAYNGTGWFTGWEGTSRKFNGVGGSTTRTIPELPHSVYNNWVYITVVFNNTTCLIYEDGVLASSYTIGAAKDDNVELELAKNLTGRIDEFRIYNGVETAAYIAAEYKTQNEPGFFEYGAVEPTGLPVYFAPIPAQRIRGAEVEPLVALTNTDTKAALVLNTDYTVAYENNASNGTGRAVVTGKGDYAGYTDARTFQILPAFDISIPAQTIRPDGTVPWQSGWVTDAETGNLLVEGTDYQYTMTLDPANFSGRAVVTGLGGYAGATVTNDFTAKMVLLVGGYTVAEEGTGLSWDSPMSLGTAITTFNAAPSNYSEIWMKEGVYSLTAELIWSFTAGELAIRGGFAGTENSPAERDPAARTEFYAGGSRSATSGSASRRCCDLVNTVPVTIDGVNFTCGYYGLTKTGSGRLTVVNSGMLNNYYAGGDTSEADNPVGYNPESGKFRVMGYNGCNHGCGLRIQAAGADIVVSNCVIAGNLAQGSYQNGAAGLLVWNVKSLSVADTLIASNGFHWSISSAPGNNHRGRGTAIWLYSAPATFERCRIVGHWNGTTGGVNADGGRACNIFIHGSSGGTRFDHCAIAGNMITAGNSTAEGDNSYAGNMLVDLSTAAATVEFDHCTVAYNYSMKSKAACALSVYRGTAIVKNSIFAHNLRGNSSSVGSDLHLLTSSAFAEVYHTLFTADATTSVSAYTPANLTIGSGVLYGDPLLATSLATVNGWKNSYRFTAANLSKLVAMNLHPLSKTGYVDDDGEWTQSEDQHSPAIDTGDPSDPVGAEPDPNGGVVNLGAYGGTAEASKSDSYTLAVQDVAIAFDGDYSQPTVSFTVGGSGSFTASAEILWSTNGTDWVFGTTLNGLTRGDTPSYALPLYVPSGSMRAMVTLHTGKVTSKPADSGETPVTKPLPPWYGKKGPANVVHVRAGAIGAGDGTSWSDAFTTLRAAFAATSAEKNEIWIATNTISLASAELDAAISVGNALTVRGGFKGWEETADERPEGAVTTVDGVNRSVCLNLNNSAAVTVERMRFYRGLAHGFQKSGAGDITLVDCRFESTSTTPGHNNGRGMHATGSSGTTRLTATRCVFANILATSGYNSGSGGSGIGAFVQNFARAIFDDCTFEGNGDVNRVGGWLYGVCAGSALFANASPTTMRGCRILANTGNTATQYGGGGTYLIDGRVGSAIIFNGNCSGSAMTNCVVAGNGVLASGAGSHTSCDTAAIAVFMGAADRTLDIVNCTIAYNIGIGVNSPGGVNVVSGAVTMKNSVVYGNWRWNGTENDTRHAADVDVKAGASFAADWSLFTADSTNSVDGASGAVIAFGYGVVYGDPLMGTLYSDISPRQYVEAGRAFYANSATLAFRKAINTHLRGARGYFDEKTGELVTDYMTRETVSPAQDAGDPRSDYRGEPDTNDGWHGRRVNMGAWGNTPWATRTKFLHGALYIR